MSIICHIDDSVHESIEALHDHIGTFGLSRKEYWTTHVKRVDMLTGEPIPFKDADQYLSQDFANKNNLKKWFKQQTPEVGLDWAKKWLMKRKQDKGLVYAPSQAELRTLCCPSMPYYEKAAAGEGGYYGVTRTLGFKDRYVKAVPVLQVLAADTKIIQDTREQSPVKLPILTVEHTLSVGDYALDKKHHVGTVIERKSLADFCGTLSGKKVVRKGGDDSPFLRFDRELARAVEKGLYVVMMVESNIADAQSFDYLPQTKWIKASPAHIFHNLRELLNKYPLSFQVVFVDGRVEMAKKMMSVFQLGTQVKHLDLQHLYEEGLL